MILERVVAGQVEFYFENEKLFGNFQYGFRKYRSTFTALTTTINNALKGARNKQKIGTLLYDLSTAFDTVKIDTLVHKL